jgi:ribosome biogenesis GTPase A
LASGSQSEAILGALIPPTVEEIPYEKERGKNAVEMVMAAWEREKERVEKRVERTLTLTDYHAPLSSMSNVEEKRIKKIKVKAKEAMKREL